MSVAVGCRSQCELLGYGSVNESFIRTSKIQLLINYDNYRTRITM